MKRLLALALLVGAGAVAPAQFTPGEPVIDFRLPAFNDAGFLAWEILGSQARAVDAGHIEVTALQVRVLSGTEVQTLETEIQSPLAVVQPKERLVSGAGQIRAVGQGFEIFGEDWSYDFDTKTAVLRRDVVVTLSGDVGDILR